MDKNLLLRQYDFELEQRNNLTSSVGIPVVAITVVGSAISALALDYGYMDSISCYFFVVFVLVSIVFFIASTFFLFRSFWGYEYQKIPSPKILSKYEKDLTEWFGSNRESCKSEDFISTAKDEFEMYLHEKIIEATDWNGQNNLRRGNFLHMSAVTVAIALFALIPACGLYVADKIFRVEKVQKIEVINFN